MIALLVACAAITAAGCGAGLDHYPKENCLTPPGEGAVKAIQDNCRRCHSRDFTTRQDICVRRSIIIDAVKTGRMPKVGKLTEADRSLILNWK